MMCDTILTLLQHKKWLLFMCISQQQRQQHNKVSTVRGVNGLLLRLRACLRFCETKLTLSMNSGYCSHTTKQTKTTSNVSLYVVGKPLAAYVKSRRQKHAKNVTENFLFSDLSAFLDKKF
jgi:hypothetical protein